jgi:hypothetical protein
MVMASGVAVSMANGNGVVLMRANKVEKTKYGLGG